jgi:exopolysaccharide biosynthesis polyprenyl glycosylphosphotransferase
MALMLVLIEGALLSVSVATATFMWARPLVGWIDVATALGQSLAVAGLCIVAFYYNDFYDLRIVRDFPAFATRLLQSFGLALLLLAAFYAVFPEGRIASGALISSFVLVLSLLLTLRAGLYAAMRRRPFVERVLILGTGPLARTLIAQIETTPCTPYRIVGVVTDSAAECPETPARLLGPLDHLGELIEQARPHRIVVALTERRGRLPVGQLLEARMKGVAVEDGVGLYERLTGKLAIEALTPSCLIFSSDFTTSRIALATARLVSIVVAVTGLVLFSPLLALIAIAIKLDSPGPIFFVHQRVGRFGQAFGLIKFRTMLPRAEATSEWVRDNAHRVTRVGRVLRKFRLDEIPQFVNMLRGELNLVGPRPHPVSNLELFLNEIPYYRLRLLVRPGITGWAQIRYGYANDLAEETEKMRYDLYFIKHLSIWLDLRILVDTLKIIVFGRGSSETTVDDRILSAGGASTR